MSNDDPCDLFSPEQEELFLACVDVIGRSGAKELVYGYQNDDVPIAEANWWAQAQFRGTKVISEHHEHPAEAVYALTMRLLQGAQCNHCKKVVTLDPDAYFVYTNSTLLDGTRWDAEKTSQIGSCLWYYDKKENKFERGCK